MYGRARARCCRLWCRGSARSPFPPMTRNARAQAAGAARSDRPRACLWREPLDIAQQTLQLAVVQAALDLGRGADAHTPQLDEARSRRLVEGVSLSICGERVLVQLGRRFTPHHLR